MNLTKEKLNELLELANLAIEDDSSEAVDLLLEMLTLETIRDLIEIARSS